MGANTEQDKNEKQKAQVIPGISKALVTRSLQKFQRLTGVSLVLSAILGAYLLSTDRSLWILAVSHAYGLIAICTVDIFLAAFNFALIRKALLPSLLWAVLTFVLQIGDILTAPEYKMTMLYFASYLFHLWAFDGILSAQVAIAILAYSARSYAKMLGPRKRKKLTYFDMGIKSSRRDFLQIMGAILGLIGLTGILAALDVIYTPTSPSNLGNSQSGSGSSSSSLPPGAIANAKDLQVGSPITFYYPDSTSPNILFKKSDGSLVALSLLCTHVCCETSFSASSNALICPCHGSIFDADTGAVFRGPAVLPLPSVELNVDASGNIFPIKVKGQSPCL